MLLLLLLLLLLLAPVTEMAKPPAGWKCRCANQSLCAPLRTPKPEKEVFAYFEDHWTNPSYNSTWTDLFSGGTVTTIAECEAHIVQEPDNPTARMSDEHLCYAHARGLAHTPLGGLSVLRPLTVLSYQG